MWNREIFGNIFRRKRRLEARLKGVKHALCDRQSQALVDLERRLQLELEEVLYSESLLWLQKSRVSSLLDGDRNTKFFHLSTLIRRKKNHVHSLKLANGSWVEEEEAVKRIALEHFASLFRAEDADSRHEPLSSSISFPIITANQL